MGRDVVLVRQKGSDTPQLQDAFAAVHNGQLVHRHQAFPELLVVQAVRGLTPAAFAGVIGVDGFLAQELLHLLERRLFLSAEEEQRIAVADNGVRIVLVDGLELGLRLKNNAGGDLTGADGGDELFKIRDLPDIGKLIDQAAHMHRKPAAVLVIRLFAKEVEHLAVRHGNQEVEAAVGVGHDQEQRCALFPDGVQVQLVIFRDLPQLLNVKGRKPRAAADQDAFGRLARDKLSRTF